MSLFYTCYASRNNKKVSVLQGHISFTDLLSRRRIDFRERLQVDGGIRVLDEELQVGKSQAEINLN